MGLFLFHSASLAPHLPHFLDALTRKHFDKKLKDSFRILTPNEEMRDDVENLLLKSEKSRGLLIGQSVQTLREWLRDLLLHYGRPRPLASQALQRKALRMVLPRYFPKLKSDPIVERRCLFELNRLGRFHALLPTSKISPWLALRGDWEKILEEKFGTWSLKRYEEESLKILRGKGPSTLEGVQEIYFLGFTHPEPLLLRCLEVLNEDKTRRDFLLFLPPMEELSRGQEAWERPMNGLIQEAQERHYHLQSPSPRVSLESYPTPVHEGRHLYRQFHEFSGPGQILIPRNGDFSRVLQEMAKGPRGLSGSSDKNSNPRLEAFFSTTREDEEESPLSFETLFDEFFEWLQSAQAEAQRSRDLHTLRTCAQLFRQIQEIRIAESIFPENLPRFRWLEILKQEILEANPRISTGVQLGEPIRWVDQGGLAQVDKLWIGGLQEGDFPSPTLPFLLAEDFQDPHWALEQELAFRQNLGRATHEVHLSLAETSLSGRALSPSPFVADWEPALSHSGDEPPLKREIRHPYAEENISRERRRSVLGELNQDAGNLQDIEGGFSLIESMQRRPLSAGYIDDYAKCPWRFFARWSLGLKKIPEEDLEMEPLSRGTFQHTLLEKIFRRMEEEFFGRKAIPTGMAIQGILAESFHELSEALKASQKHPNIPMVVLDDQLERMKAQVEGVLEDELADWERSSERLLPRFLEWSFGKGGKDPWMFPLANGRSIPFSGAIDRIDLSHDSARFLVVDYKAGSTAELAKSVKERMSFQLFIYLSAVSDLLWPDKEAIGALYWNLREQKKIHGFALKENFKPFTSKILRGEAFLKDEAYHELQQGLRDRLEANLLKILSGDFSLHPEQCLGKRCEFWDICRFDEKLS